MLARRVHCSHLLPLPPFSQQSHLQRCAVRLHAACTSHAAIHRRDALLLALALGATPLVPPLTPPAGAEPSQGQQAPIPLPPYCSLGPYSVEASQKLQVTLPPELQEVQLTAWLTAPADTASSTSCKTSSNRDSIGTSRALNPALIVFSGGFLVASSAYSSYYQHFASWGHPVIHYDIQMDGMEPLPDALAARLISTLIDAHTSFIGGVDGSSRGASTSSNGSSRGASISSNDSRPRLTSSCLVGHSRGAKLSVLAAAVDPRVTALCLIDPVDNTYDAPAGTPSSLPALEHLSIPVAIIGAGRNSDCIPKRSNYNSFYTAAATAGAAPVLLAVAREAGHLQFLDAQTTLQRSVCAQGKVNEQALGVLTKGCITAWAAAAAASAAQEESQAAGTAGTPAACTAAVHPAVSMGDFASWLKGAADAVQVDVDIRGANLQTVH